MCIKSSEIVIGLSRGGSTAMIGTVKKNFNDAIYDDEMELSVKFTIHIISLHSHLLFK